jgi:signal transduction histidine kinase
MVILPTNNQLVMDSDRHSFEELYDFCRYLMDYTSIGIVALDRTGKVKLINPVAIRFLDLNLSQDESQGKDFLGSLGHFSPLHDTIKDALQKRSKSFEIKAELFNEKYLNIYGKSIPEGLIVIIYDITPQKEMEANSIFSIVSGQENERRRLGREIHDGIGPVLSSVKLELESLIDELESTVAGPPIQKLMDISKTIDSVTNDLRDLSHRLLPRLLDEFGLFSAFSSLTSRMNKTTSSNLEFYCNFNSESRFNKEIELNLYRCGQELINNAVKYAKADEILVQLILHDQSIVLMVEDDGKGFKPVKTDPESFGIGLTNVETRVRTLNGEFTIDSVVDKGTTASIEIPL